MAENLVIVESPAKAKTIEGFLGNGYVVKSSFGHVRDLVKNDKGIDISNDFEPNYEVSPEKVKVVDELKKLSKKATTVWLATDEDREGEAISWHLYETLGLKKSNTKRIVFHEITKKAIQDAISNPRFIDINLVDAQQARRILDRLVGFELSPVLWKKVKPSLSAGRVQSVSVRLIVEREREIEKFTSASSFRIVALFKVKDKNGNATILKAELPKRIQELKDAKAFLEKLADANFKIQDLEVKPGKKSPTAPFTTSTLQQEASRKLGFSVKQTMVVAQRLYESGKITYMRTDSVNLSQLAIDSAKAAITKMFGKEYSNPRQYKTKSASAQEAHEAIRPTYLDQPTIDGDSADKRLYELIYKRTIASQMADAQLERTVVTISNDKTKDNFTATGEVVRFDGFLRVYFESTDDETEENESGLLPPLKIGQDLEVDSISATEKYSTPPARYTEASLVKKLEELGIGRPSTYAPTISTVLKRGYVEKRDKDGTRRDFQVLLLKNDKISKTIEQENTGAEKSKLFPSDLGLVVTDFLLQYFDDVMDYGFTAKIENEFDEVAAGKLKWNSMIKDFYKPFKKDVDKTIETAERIKGERELGLDPDSGKPVIARMGRYGAMIQIGKADDTEKPRFAKVPTGQSIETITFEEALALFGAQGPMGNYENKEVSVNVGRFGPYIKWGEEFVSLPKGTDLGTVGLDKAIEYIKEKQKADAPVGTFEQKAITKGSGRFGPYIKWDGIFINVPRRYDFANLSEAEMHELIEAKIKKEENRYITRWPEEKISLENGRWGPLVKYGKKLIYLPKKDDGTRTTVDEAKALSLDAVKAIIETQVPGAFAKKNSKSTAKKSAKASPKKKK